MISYWFHRKAPYLWLWAARRVPRPLRYWVTIQSICEATTGEWSHTVLPDLTCMDMLERLERKKATVG